MKRKLTEEEIAEDKSLNDRLEDAANLIASQFTPIVRSFFNEVADKVLGIKRWELMAGSVLAQYSQGTLVSPELDPMWKEPTEVDKLQTCPICSTTFIPTHIGQIYCSTSCGSRARKEELERKIAEDRKRVRNAMLAYLSSKKEEAKKSGVEPSKIYMARNVYNVIHDALTNDTLFDLKVIVLEDAPDDKIVLAH
jgi:hypothetical protein